MTPSDIEALLREADTVANIADHWAMPAIDGRPLDKIIADLAVALRECAEDAERYRWLRTHPVWQVRELPNELELLDKRIDAARREGKA